MLVHDPEVSGGVRPKVLDFGLAKLAELAAAGVETRTGTLLGTPHYMSPEQCRGAGTLDARSDIYSLGCILFEMTCGEPPFHGEAMGELIGKHQFVAPRSPRDLHPELPAWFEEVILRALAKDPDDRYPSMEELVTALEAGGARAASRRAGSSARAPIGLDETVRPAPKVAAAPGRRRTPYLVAGAVAVAAISAAVVLAATRDPDGGAIAAVDELPDAAPRADAPPGPAVDAAAIVEVAPADAPPAAVDAAPPRRRRRPTGDERRRYPDGGLESDDDYYLRLRDEAGDANARKDWKTGIRKAKLVYKLFPTFDPVESLQMIVFACCGAGDRACAQKHFAMMDRRFRGWAFETCAKLGIELER
jgi:hypothetical protein